MKRALQTMICLVGGLLFLGTVWQVQAQDEVGGPYDVDDNTVLLLHFDGDGTNQSNLSEAEDAMLFGNYSFLPNQGIPELGQVIYLKNDSEEDSSRAIVPHYDALSLTESWTIEGWVNIFTFSTEAGGHNWVSRLLNKPGVNVFYEANYFVELWGSTNYFATGFFAPGTGWPAVDTPSGFSQSGRWYHITFVRDDEEKVVVQMVHNEQRELVFLDASTYTTDTTATSRAPLYIGDAGCSETGTSCEVRGWLDGAVDEVRISDVVRPFVPPFFVVETLPNQPSDATEYVVNAAGYKLGGGEVASATLHYDVGNGYQDVSMTAIDDSTFSGSIPGQPAGTTVRYYISGESDDGLEGRTPLTPVGDNFYSFEVVAPNVQTLHLTFEEGSGVPQDQTEFGHEIVFWGENEDPTYSTAAAAGDYSLQFDSSMAFVPAPAGVLTSNEMTVDLWFNPDTLINETRLFIKQGATWWQPNFQVRFYSNNRVAAGSFYPDAGAWTDGALTLDTSLTAGTWYNAYYVVTDDTAHFEIRNVDGERIAAATISTADNGLPVSANGPLTLGGVNTGTTEDPVLTWPFMGKIDDVKVFNYAMPFTPAEEEPEEPVDPMQTLELTFDEGEGVPGDGSELGHEVTLWGAHGDPTYSGDAAAGDYALAFDSSMAFVAGPSEELASREMTVDLWFNATDTLINETRLFIKQGDPWWQPNYQIRFYPDNMVAAGTFHEAGSEWTDDELQIGPLEPDTWYHAFYVVADTVAHFEVRDTEDQIVGAVTIDVEGTPIMAQGHLTLGGVNTGTADSPEIVWPFMGMLDEVKVYNYALSFTPTDTDAEDELGVPDQVTLAANYPNPFNPQTTIGYALPKAMQVRLQVFDVLGRRVALLVDGMETVGTHTVQFDAAHMASGLYFYQIETPDRTITRKMLLVK